MASKEDAEMADVGETNEEDFGIEAMDDANNEDMDEDDNSDNEEEEAKETGSSSVYLPQSTTDTDELEMEPSAYVLYHQASLGYPCLSFDVLVSDDTSFPLTVYGVAGTQADRAERNALVLFKMDNLHKMRQKKRKEDDEDDDEEDEEDDDEDDPARQPRLRTSLLQHMGAVNRIRAAQLGPVLTAATWSETGVVNIWNLNEARTNVDRPISATESSNVTFKTSKKSVKKGLKKPKRTSNWQPISSDALFTFRGHKTEGYAVQWSPLEKGLLATGDCNSVMFIWRPQEGGSWSTEKALKGHQNSIEDIVWSPTEPNVLATCSVDKSIGIWDTRSADIRAQIKVEEAHGQDVNVIDWNSCGEPFIASGGDDGRLKIWDLRSLQSKDVKPVASFEHHKGSITSVEWHPSDATVLASSGADDQIALWDLALERERDEEGPEGKLPPQLLFIHQGMSDVKELHWHPKIQGTLMATSKSGLDVFKSISV